MTLNLNQSPFFDDYDEDKRFLQILFRPRKAVQTRELTQLQTILQNQISRFGYHVFKEGSMVIPGEIGFDLSYDYVTIQDTFNLSDVDVSELVGKIIVGRTSTAVAEIVNVVDAEGGDPKTLYVKYLSGNSSGGAVSVVSNGTTTLSASDVLLHFSVGMTIVGGSGTIFPSGNVVVTEVNGTNNTIKVSTAPDSSGTFTINTITAEDFGNDETIAIVENLTVTDFAKTSASSATGIGAAVKVNRGVYFVGGRFCLALTQTAIISKYTNTPSGRVGFVVTETIVDENSDTSLVDNAIGSPNHNAPGAARLFVSLDLDFVESGTPNPNNFVELAHIENGIIQSKIERAEYAELEKALARRTYDANGDFSTKAFRLDIREHLNDGSNRGIYPAPVGDETKIALGVEPGKAYVRGFEVQTLATTYLDMDKARETDVVESAFTNIEIGSWTTVESFNGTFNIASYELVNIKDDFLGAGNTIGTARVRGFERTSVGSARLWLFDVSMNIGKTFSVDAKSIVSATTATTYANISLVDGRRVLNEVSNNVGVFALPNSVIKTLEPSGGQSPIYTVRTTVSGVSTAGGLFEIPLGSNVAFATTSVNNYYITKNSDGTQPAGWSVTLNPELTTATFSGLGAGESVTAIITYSKRLNNAAKTKTSTNNFESGIASASTVVLAKCDVFSVSSITSSVDGDVTDRYTLDSGMRDNYYDYGRIVLNAGESLPGGTLSVSYTYFAHGAGDYFSVDSYSGIDYVDIPTYTSGNGTTFNLSDCVDFRPRINEGGAGFNPLTIMPVDGSPFICDIEYYLPRVDKLFVTSSGGFVIKKGVAATSPKEPDNIDDAMLLYTISIPAYTFAASDIVPTMQDNRGYTMRDIGKLEKRIENLEYYTSLNMLEQDTLNRFIDDGSGVDAFKNGFIVDNFSSHLVGDVANADYNCALDVEKSVLRPSVEKISVDLQPDEGSLSGLVVNTNTITLPYTSETLVSQTMCSGTVQVNPYGSFFWNGVMKLSPSEDAYYDTGTGVDISPENPNYYVEFDVNGNRNWHRYSWGDWVKYMSGGFGGFSRNIRATINSATVYDNDGNKLPSWSMDAWGNLRNTSTGNLLAVGVARKDGSAMGMNPYYTKDVAGKKIVDGSVVFYMRSKTITFSVAGLRPNTRVFAFFDGVDVNADCSPATLVTDASGAISGTFTIPATATKRFRVGAKQFKLTDSATNNDELATTTAFAIFVAGSNQTNSVSGVVSTSHVETAKENVVSRDRLTNIRNYFDPIAQSFMIANMDGGCFLSKLKLFFATKDDTNIPVRVQIRNVENGYPGNYVVPYSDVVLYPSEVTTTTNGSVATEFVFQDPIYLENDTEYCFIVWSSSTKYTIWSAQLGANEYGTSRKISKQPYSGVFFKSQNATTWVASPDSDLTFVLERCLFTSGGSGSLSFENAAPDATTRLDGYYINCNMLNFPTTDIQWHCKRTAVGGSLESSFTQTVVNQTVETGNEYHIVGAGDFVLQATVGTSNANISPVIDTTAMNMIAVENIINNDSTSEDSTSGGNAIARYMTKPVVLVNASNSLRIIFDAFMPSGSDIKVYYKALSDDSNDSIGEVDWVDITSSESNGVVASDRRFNEHEYSTGTIPEFSAFAVKIVLLSSNSARVPLVTNFRAIALDV